MMGHQEVSAQLFYDFQIEDHVPADHILRRIDAHLDLECVRSALKPFYSNTGRPSIDPDLMMRMLIVGYAGASGQNVDCARRSTLTLPIACSASLA
jgi:transposase